MECVIGTVRARRRLLATVSQGPSYNCRFVFGESDKSNVEACLIYRGSARFTSLQRLLSFVCRKYSNACNGSLPVPDPTTVRLCFGGRYLDDDTDLKAVLSELISSSRQQLEQKRMSACGELKRLLCSDCAYSRADGALGVWAMALHSVNWNALRESEGLLEALLPLLTGQHTESQALAAAAVWALCAHNRAVPDKMSALTRRRLTELGAHTELIKALSALISRSDNLARLGSKAKPYSTVSNSDIMAMQMFFKCSSAALACFACDLQCREKLKAELPLLLAFARTAGGIIPREKGAFAEQWVVHVICHALATDSLAGWLSAPPTAHLGRKKQRCKDVADERGESSKSPTSLINENRLNSPIASSLHNPNSHINSIQYSLARL